MGQDADDEGQRAPVVWALAVRETAVGPPYAEVIVEVGPALHGDLAEQAVDSGFVLAGDPPETTAVVEVRGGRLERLVLVGGRQVWEPASPVAASPGWLSAAGERGWAVVLLVAPGTWPPGLMELEPSERAAAFTRSLAEANATGLVLHGLATVQELPGDAES